MAGSVVVVPLTGSVVADAAVLAAETLPAASAARTV